MSASPTPPTPYTVRDATLDALRQYGITTLFGNPGSTELPLFRNFPGDFRYVLGLQESVVVGMADGHAQATGNAACVNLHSAAGVGHAMGAIFTAYKNRTPLIVTAGQQARSILPYEPFLYSGRATELPQPYVKWSCEPARAEDVPAAIARAYHVAMQEPRGPVFVSIPADDWDRPAQPVQKRVVSQSVRPDAALLAQLGDALDAAQNPVFVTGAAVDRGGAWDAVVALAERFQVPTYGAPLTGRYGFPQNHPLFAGMLLSRRDRVVEALQGHDLVVVIGAPAFIYHVEFPEGAHVPDGAALFQLVEDPVTASWTPAGTAIVGNIRQGLEELLARPAPERRIAPRQVKAETPRLNPPPDDQPMPVQWVFQTVADLRRPGDMFIEEAPSARGAMPAHLPIVEPNSFHAMCSGGLGFGMAATVGVALGSPGRRVISLVGDGSVMYTPQSIWTAHQLQLPITYIVLNNSRYAALQRFAPVFGYRPDEAVAGTDLPDLNFVGLAQAMGCQGHAVTKASELRAALERAFAATGPTVVEVTVA